MKEKAYARAGVDIDLGNRVKATLPRLLASTHRPEVLGRVGGFGGLFALNLRQVRQPILVSSVDGVGTKLKIAFAMNRHDTIGEDLVNHCVNDIVVLGAEPLFFLDYLGTGELQPHVFNEIVTGFARGCSNNGCALIGGETAQMPGFYQKGEYDVSGTIVGMVDKSRLLDGKGIRPGDAVVGLGSSGLHTNGYSLAREILFKQMKLTPKSRVAGLEGSIGEELLKVHVSYAPLLLRLLRKRNRPGRPQVIKGLAHITGGGFVDNIPRVLPRNCNVVIRKDTWEMPPLFRLLREKGGVEDAELYQVFNMGIGMVMITRPSEAPSIVRSCKAAHCPAWIIGEVTKGRGVVRLKG